MSAATPKSPLQALATIEPGSESIKAATCCGCVNMRTGTFAILVFHLLFGIYSVSKDLATGSMPYSRRWGSIIAYVLFTISTLVYVALVYSAAKRNVSVYLRAAKVSVVLFVVSSVMSVTFVAMGMKPEMNQFEPGVVWVSMAIAIALLGYWTWVVYKYAEVMEAEVHAKRRRVGAPA